MSYIGEDSDNEVEGIMRGRPPSSYGSMKSDEPEDMDDFDDPPATTIRVIQGTPGLMLQRPESPETAITERTHTNQSSVHREGVFLKPAPGGHRAETFPAQHRSRVDKEHTVTVGSEVRSNIRAEREPDEAQSERQTEFSETHMEEEPNEGGAMEVQQEDKKEREMSDDYDEIVLDSDFSEPAEPPPPPPEGHGLQFRHKHRSLTLSHLLSAMVSSLRPLRPVEMAYLKRSLCGHYRFASDYSTIAELTDALDLADKLIELCGEGEALYLTIRSLQSIKKDELANTLRKTCRRALLQHDLKLDHDRRFYSLYEGCCRPGQQRFISEVYSEPLTVIRDNGDPVNTEHEVRRTASTTQETVIRASDIFRPLPNDPSDVRTIMMTGIPASGLTVVVNNFIIDWKEGKTNQDFQFVFPLAGKELHLGKEGDQTFLLMLATFYPEADNIRFIEKEDCLILFIIDGLDLCEFPLNFKENAAITSIATKAPVDALLTSLIKGTMLPHARVWITSHRGAAHKIPSQFISRFVELRGLTDAQKEIYFTKRTKDPELGRKVWNHVKKSRTLQIICHIPLFSWMVAYVFERGFRDPEYGARLPALTTFYSQFVIIQMDRSFERYRGYSVEAQRWKDEDKLFLERLGKMAYRMILEERDEFSVNDLLSVELKFEDLDSRDELTTEVRRTSDDQKTWVFKFVHYTVQEYMAAMYVYVTFRKQGKNVMDSNKSLLTKMLSKDRPMMDLYRTAIDQALASQRGQFDLFLRFVLGLVTPGTEDNLRGYLLPHYHPKPKGMEDVVKYINKKIKENAHPGRCRNLELCLVELQEGKDEK
ncbi:NACHT, LRR and PYD domains-containing protein 3 [Triplophysa dalaica]|uniref:NACHT, LRR and PYD domains-containing protein 3 n=1 Tax=Triplophysa dalaica TaxID=1582913 RepID=UPI0024DFEE61|nr:NACHT, LRR and PYD domains-containing protein 3 [Triplophysa dalaica]XP_056612896.1 NACHT, LRR and PYD domains-containing protein 3 [Triplophysa dalaica]XP_056612898.1 NACHT, LRR and PYD domains-containing protein 3 [Triplophysa dalaica]